MKIINLSEVVSITTSMPSTEAEFFKGLANANQQEIFAPSKQKGSLIITSGVVTKENEVKGVLYPLVNFKLKDGSNAVLKIHPGALALEQAKPVGGEVKAIKESEARKLWKRDSTDALVHFLVEAGLFESKFVTVF